MTKYYQLIVIYISIKVDNMVFYRGLEILKPIAYLYLSAYIYNL